MIHIDIAFLLTHHICIVEQILTLIRGAVLNETLIVFKQSLDWEISPRDLPLDVSETLISRSQFRG